MSFADDLHRTTASDLLLGPSRPRGRGFAQILPGAALLVALAGWLGAPGCASSGSAKTAPPANSAMQEEGRALFGRGGSGRAPGAAGGGAEEAAAGGNWTIVLAAFRGDDAAAQAGAALADVRTVYGLPQAFIETRGPNTVVAVGSFADPKSAQAQGELERLRDFEARGERPFAGAFLAPPYSVQLGSRPEYNLLTARQTYGSDALYTLQIGAYGRDDLARPTDADLREVRRAAEEAAATLRREGELAFYYHGPNRSMVTVGVFDLSDFDPQTPAYQSRRLMDLRRRFPHNLYNGAGIRERRPGRSPQMQASSLVSIPSQ